MASTPTSNETVKPSAIWDYEAPQYCDFSDTQTFADNPDVDKFFLTDHESKENISSEGLENGVDSSDSDLFQTPMTVRDNKSVSTISSCTTDYFSPKSTANSASATPIAKRASVYTLRQTPLRDLYQNGASPLHVPGQKPKNFGSRVKSNKKTRPSGLAKSVTFEEDLKPSQVVTPNKRETFDVIEDVTEKLQELNVNTTQIAANVEVSEEVPVTEVVDHNNINEALLFSEDEDDSKLNETVCENKSENINVEEQKKEDSKKVEVSESASEVADFHTITDNELEEVEQNTSVVANTSRRSSYVVRSPSIRVVHFEDEPIALKLDTIGEDGQSEQVTPIQKPSESSKKIKTRQQTPMVQPTATTSKKITFNLRIKKYIKRFSKTSINEEGASKAANPDTKDDKRKKRVTISAPKSTNNTTVVKVKKTMSLKPSFSFRKSSTLSRSKSFAHPREGTDPTKAVISPYQGLAVLNNKFMNSVRHYSPFVATKPKVTIPKAPHLLTEQRLGMRKYNTMPSLQPTTSEPAPPKKSIAPRPSVAVSKSGTSISAQTKHVTKAKSPNFCTAARIKLWHLKHDGQSQVDGQQQNSQVNNMPTFKARPAPDFKKLQAISEKRKKEAQHKAKQEIRTSKLAPFSFESRAHSVKPQNH